MHAVFRILFIFALRLQHEPLEDVIIPRDDAAHKLAKNNNNNNNKRNQAAFKRTLS